MAMLAVSPGRFLDTNGRPVTRGENPPRNIFSPGKMCWTQFKNIGHSLNILGPSRKTPPLLVSQAGHGPD